ncbi:hypothetical protein [Burkholderia sp. MSMB1826]|uniref:hypothetical protein n=1 Tax=Burkholderia sp. MSMB1826 TaxID=1637875 RepID=UPI00075D5C72|nr:hypothetical protein [Burkholderia sp. MSMB1826]KVL18098.1 hypothetical protein WS95_18215 [Burkholderia sp. MSMB1826]
MFDRTHVGLLGDRYGTPTLGRRYGAVVDSLGPHAIANDRAYGAGATLGFANVTGLATPSTRTQRAATIGIRHRFRPQANHRRPAALCNPAWTRAGRTGIIRGIRASASAKPVHSAPGARRIGIRRRPAADSEIAIP